MMQGSKAQVRSTRPDEPCQIRGRNLDPADSRPISQRRRGKRYLPRWDSKNLKLWLGRQLLKRFQWWASDQIAILEAFQQQVSDKV